MTDTITTLAPSPWVARFAHLIPVGGEVLDLACGAGRHTRLLVRSGYRVEAVDRNAELLTGLAGEPGVTTRAADLEGGPWPYFGRAFDGIVVTNYLWRPLLPHLFACLGEYGVLIYETFMRGQERYGRPSNPDFLLEPGELLTAFTGLELVAFEQGLLRSRGPALIQRLCAVRGSIPVSLE